MKMFKSVSIVLLMWAVTAANGQALPPSVWSIAQATDLRTGFQVDYHGSFTVHGDSVMWKQKNVEVDYFFRIIGVSGQWSDPDSKGRVLLDVVFRGRPGTMEFSGDGVDRRVRIRMESGERDLLPYVFSVSGVEKI